MRSFPCASRPTYRGICVLVRCVQSSWRRTSASRRLGFLDLTISFTTGITTLERLGILGLAVELHLMGRRLEEPKESPPSSRVAALQLQHARQRCARHC